MVLVPPGAVGLKFWRPDAVDKRTADAWNVEDKSLTVTLSNGDKTAISTAANGAVRSTQRYALGAVGKYYTEFVLDSTAGVNPQVGLKNAALVTGITATTNAVFFTPFNGNISVAGTVSGNIGVPSNGDVISFAFNAGTKTVWFRRNAGLWNGDAAADPGTGTNGISIAAFINTDYCLWHANSGTLDGSVTTIRTEVAEFTYSVPSGFTSWMGETVPVITGVGDLAADVAAISGAGDVGSAETTGTGTLAADVAVVSAAGVSASTGTGVLAAQAATMAGVGVSASTGTGTLAAQAVTAAGTGISASISSGALAAQSATASGAGTVASTGTGALAAQASSVTGTGSSVSTGTGALQAASATIVGAGASSSTGTGSLVAGSAEVAGTGTAAAGNAGALIAQEATVAGLGISVSTGTGTVQAGAATVAGAGLGVSTGIGALIASPATVVGEGVVLDAGSIIGIGALVAGAATIAGEGGVTGEVAPPISAAIGGHWRPEPHRPPPVEGIGYGILPQLEGEAHGVVLVAGAGAALPRISGVGTGAAGVDGRSAARLSVIKAVAVGDRGQAGAAHAVLKAAAASGSGVAGAYGTAAGTIRLKGSAVGRYDDDGAAMLALLLAA